MARGRKAEIIDALMAGELSYADIAAKCGVTKNYVCSMRYKLGLPKRQRRVSKPGKTVVTRISVAAHAQISALAARRACTIRAMAQEILEGALLCK
jgi:hypothetical protein